MKATDWNPADILRYMMLGVATLGGAFGALSRIDLLISEPFGSLMVFSRTVCVLAALAGLYGLASPRSALRTQLVRLNGRRGYS